MTALHLLARVVPLLLVGACGASAGPFTVHPSTRTVTSLAVQGTTLVAGTTGGLVLLDDGGRTHVQVPGTPVRALCPSGEDLLVATDRGLLRLCDQGLVKLMDGPVTAVLEDAEGVVVGSTFGHVVRLVQGRPTDLARLPCRSPVGSLARVEGRLYAASVDGLWSVDAAGAVTPEQPDDDPLSVTAPVLAEFGGRLLAGTPVGLFERRAGRWARLGRSTHHVTALWHGSPDDLVVGTAGEGTFRYRRGRLERLNDGEQLVTAVAVHEGEVVVGTQDRGALRLSAPPRPAWSLADEPPGNAVTALAAVRRPRRLVVGTFDDGMGMLGGLGWAHFRPSNGTGPADGVTHVACDDSSFLARLADGTVVRRELKAGFVPLGKRSEGWPKDWTSSLGSAGDRAFVGTLSALYLDGPLGWSVHAPKPALQGVLVLDVALVGREAWVATHQHGLVRWDSQRDEWRRFTLGSGLTDSWVTSVEVLGEEVWVGTFSGGIVRLRSTEAQRCAAPDDFLCTAAFEQVVPGQGINALLAADGALYAATQEGLLRFEGDASRTFGEPEGLSSAAVSSLACDGEVLWVGTDAGLCSAPLDELRRY